VTLQKLENDAVGHLVGGGEVVRVRHDRQLSVGDEPVHFDVLVDVVQFISIAEEDQRRALMALSCSSV
jgi:hypothetical protein